MESRRQKRKRKKKRSFKAWPPPKNGMPYGPNALQRLLFIETLPDEDEFLEDSAGRPVNIRRPHYHTSDCVLYIGGAGSGKSIACVARVLSLCARYPGTKAVIGSLNHPILKRNIIPHVKQLLSVGKGVWNHPLIRRGPTDKRPTVEWKNGSEITFLNMENDDVLRGCEGTVIMVDEVNLLPSGDSVDELQRRLRSWGAPIKALLMTMNPEKSNGWPYTKFHLRQWEKKYIEKGGKPIEIAERCKCQFCYRCLDGLKGEFLWTEERKCPNCGIDKPRTVTSKGVVFDCPGDQQFWRVIRTRSADNAHNPPDYVQNMKSSMDAESYQRWVEGEIGESRQGRCYVPFNEAVNVYEENVPLDSTKDIAWALDFNTFPQCSVVLQETDNGANVIDNVIVWDADMEDVVKVFTKRFPLDSFTGVVHVYGDANGWWGQGSTKKKTNYQIIMDDLGAAGYKVKMHVPPRKRNPSVTDRIQNVNRLLRESDGGVRLMINPKAEHLIKSLAEVKWNPSTGKESDACDKAAKESTNKTLPMAMTHPAAALGYYVHARFPIIRKKSPAKFVAIPEVAFIKQEDNKIVRIPAKKGKRDEDEPLTVGKILREEGGGISSSRVRLNERLEQERQEREERERRIAEKIAAFGGG